MKAKKENYGRFIKYNYYLILNLENYYNIFIYKQFLDKLKTKKYA